MHSAGKGEATPFRMFLPRCYAICHIYAYVDVGHEVAEAEEEEEVHSALSYTRAWEGE